jgi:putative sterol carrier protein
VDPDTRAKYVLERSVSLRLSDLDVTWSARLSDAGLTDLTDRDDERAQIRLTVGSDDLIALVEGRMAVPTAFATGRVRVQASPFDLLRMRSFL